MSTGLRNGALVTEVLARLADALAAGQPPPTRRGLARDLDVTEHAARRALDEARALTQLSPSPPSSPTQSPSGRTDLTQDPTTVTQPHPPTHPPDETTHPNLTHPAPGTTMDSPGLTQGGDLGETRHPLGEPVGDTGRTAGDPPPHTTAHGRTQVARWPLLLLALPAFVAIWGGWVGLGQLAGFGVIQLLPGIWDDLTINTAVTLPIGLETYAAYALHVALSGRAPTRTAQKFARWSAVGALTLGAGGQVAYHLMTAAHLTQAPWGITAAVAVLPVVVLGMGAALAHLIHPSSPTRPPGDAHDEKAG